MTTYIFTNNAKGVLESSIGISDVSLSLETGDGVLFPSPGAGEGFHLIVFEGSKTEWMVCTNRSSNTLTVTRSGSPQTFSVGAKVHHRLHEDALNNILQKAAERTVAVDPDGSLAALYTGEEVYQSVTGVWWKHCTSTTWKEMNL